ncbi:MAG: GEVED domain-containing protein, partial [Flavobacteriaceae bacterium]
MRNFTVFRSDPRTSKTKRWLGLLTFCFGILMGQMSFAQTVTVGTGITTNTNVPTSSCWAYSFSQQIYTAAQIGMPDGGDIMKLRFYYDSSGTTYANWDEWTVYVANTTKTSFTSTTDWEPISNFTQVFSGEISVDPSGGWFDIDFSNTFDYTGGNLIIAVHENAPGYSCTPAYRVTTSDANTSMYVRRDGTDYDLSAISTVTASGRLGVVPQLQLVFPTTVIPNCAIDLFPADIATDVVRNPVLTWADNGGLATNYDVYFGTTTNPGFVTNVTSLNYTPVVPLDANTTYYWKVVPKNDIGEAIGCLEQTFTTGTSLLYCTSAPTSNDGSGITNVSMGSTSFAVTDVTYYNYTDSIIDITAGIENAASVTFATGYTYHTNIWIDLDDNGEFNNDDELVFQGESTNANPTMYDTSFMLNISAALGQHKMRIGTADSGQATPNPCYSGSYGVTIDMMVNILAPPPFCATPNAITSLALTPGSDSVSGVITPDGTASGYVVARTTTPTLADAPDNGVFYPVGEYEDGVVVVYNGTDTSFTDTSALPNTQYYYHVYAYNSDPDFDCLIVYSATSVTANTTTCVGTPIIVGESNVRTTGAVLNWTSALYADTTGVTYTVEVSTTPDFSIIYNTIFDLGVYSTSVSGLIPNATYYWRVKAVGTSCDSDWANSSFIAQSSYSPIAVTGFTDDVIADGIGDATTSTTNAVDAVDYAYMSNSFKVTASSNPITYALPVSRNLESPNIAGLNFIMPDYAYSNSLRLATQGQSGTLTFTEAFPLTDIYFAFTSGSGNSTMSAEILFDDSTSQLVTDIALTDWYGAGTATTPALIDNLGRVLRTTTATPSTGNAKIFQISIPIDQANHSKSVTGVTFTKTSTGAEPVANIFAISGKIIGVCPILGDTSVENETAFTADLNWTLSNAGAGSLPADVTYTIQLYADEDLTVPVGAPATGITTTTYAATDLSDQTTYYYTVTANNGTCDSATISGEFTTTCAVFATAFNEGFDTVPTGGTTNPSLPSCWSMIDTGAGYGYVSSTTPDSAPNNFYIYNSSDNSGDYILVSPETDNVGNGNYRIKFVARSGSNNYVLQVGTLSDNSDPTTFTLVESISLTSSNTEYTVVLPATTDDYFGFRHGLGGTYRSIYIDTITYQEIPTCPDVTDLVLSNPTADGTDIGWTGVGTSFDIEWGPKGYTPGIGEEIGSATAVSTNPYTISGLPGGNYSVYVRQNCDPAEAGYWAGPADFHLTMAGDDCSDPIVIASLPYMTTDDTANYTDNPAIEGSPGSSCGSTSSYLNGNDVVYSYTATFTGTIGVSITPTATYAGIFAYDSCANIGVECLGGVASSSASQKGFDLDVTEGSTYYFVISTWASPQTTGYVLEINPPACPEPTGLATADATTDSVELSWAGTSDSFDIEYGVSGFTPGTGTTVTGVTSPYVLSGLDDNTEYDVYVRGVCALNESDWVGSVTFTTLEDTTPVAPVCEIAVNLTFPEFGDATTWELLDGDGTAVLSGGPYSFWDYYDFTISEAILAINPPYSLEITIEDEYGDNEVSYSVTVGGTTDTNATGTIEVFGDDDIIVETVSIMACPTCPAPSNLGIANIATTSVDLTWTGTASAFDVEWGTAGFTPTGTPSTGFSGVTSPQALTGLTAMTSYDFYVRQDCGTDGTSAWAGPFNFTTPCEAINTFPFTETFETDSASRDCWSNQFETGTTAWTYMAGAFSPLGAVTSANTGALNATFGMSSYTANVTKFVSPALNLSALTTPEVTFWYANQAWGGDQNELRVYYKTSANGTWELIPGAVYNTNVNEWTEVSLALPSPSSEYFIAFEGTNAYGYGIALDDVVVNDNIAPCEQPTDFVAANATFESVELTWTGTAGSYTIEYGAPGFTSGTGTTVTGVSSPYILSGLDDETQYDVYIKGVCGSISSDWVGPVTFTTLEIPPPNPCAIEVSFSSTGWGDATSWELIDGSGQVVLSGGTYGNNYSDTQTYLAVNPPYSLRVMITAYCDNNPTYNVTVGGVANISGTITDCSPVDVTIPLVGDLTPCIPACPAPTNLAVTGLTYESADLSWVSSGSLFDIEWGVAGFTPTGNPSTGLSGLTATSQTLTGLTAETHYEFYVRRDCDTDGTSTWAGPFAFYTGYCIPTTTYTYDGYGILGFSTTDGYTNISNENNGLVAGYSNYSNLAVTQSAGSSVNFSITVPGYTLAAIWIDLNQDLIFDPVSELLGTFEVSGTANTVFTGSMPIPPGTPNGDYRIRVRSHDVWNEETPTPCGEMFYGETEDYTLTVVDVPTCLPPSGLSATSLTLTTAELSWISAGTLFDIEWGVTGFTPTETPTVSGVANPYLLTTPVPGAYQFYVRQDCGTDGTSLWVGPYTVVVGAYSDGDIPTQHNTAPNVNSTDYCTPEATITIDVPAGMQIAGLQVQYSMTAHNGAYMSEQRSFIYSPTLNVGEASITSGAGTGGTYNYSRSMNFANGATGTVDFVLRAWRTWTAFEQPTDCNTNYNYVNNGTWVITPTFEPIP